MASNTQLLTDTEKLQLLFDLQQAYVDRTKTTFSVISLTIQTKSDEKTLLNESFYDELYTFLSTQVRNSDKVFKHDSKQFLTILLAFSGEQEGYSFLNRIFNAATKELKLLDHSGQIIEPLFIASISEIANSKFKLEDILTKNINTIKTLKEPQTNEIISIQDFAQFDVETIKVSIIEDDFVTRSILQNLLENMVLPNFQFDIQTFEDGFDFLQSNWYNSSHTHLVILNDILPRQNGIEIMNELRSLPNDEKFIILFMSKRDTEDAIMYAYDNGADAYFVRPFNLRLLETQIKNTLRRLRL